jgi:hypothetical protein
MQLRQQRSDIKPITFQRKRKNRRQRNRRKTPGRNPRSYFLLFFPSKLKRREIKKKICAKHYIYEYGLFTLL